MSVLACSYASQAVPPSSRDLVREEEKGERERERDREREEGVGRCQHAYTTLAYGPGQV